MSIHSQSAFSEDMIEKICVRLATDREVDEDFGLHDDVRAFLRNIALPRRRVVDHLYERLHEAKTMLVDERGNPVIIRDMSPIESDAVELWLRDWIKPRSSVAPRRRTRIETRERLRLLITLLRLVFPKESSVWGKEPVTVGLATRMSNPDEDAF